MITKPDNDYKGQKSNSNKKDKKKRLPKIEFAASEQFCQQFIS